MNIKKLLFGLAFIASSSNFAFADTINFDGTGAPGIFVSTSPLTNLYNPQGVNFSDGNWSILNQSGNFGFDALSGTDFLAYNTSITNNVESVFFSSAVDSVSIWGAGGGGGNIGLEAYDSYGSLLGSVFLNASTTWQQLSVSATGISRLKLTGNGLYGAFDDLSFEGPSAVPLPAALPMLLTGLGMFGFVSRLRKRKF